MKNIRLIGTTMALLAAVSHAVAQGTALTYQGRLDAAGAPAAGSFDLTFALFDSGSGGTQQGNTITNTATAVTNGLFTVTLDFGNQFPGAPRWLQIGVRTNGNGAFATLNPRQEVTAMPYATTAGNVVSGGLAAGTYGSAVTFNNAANSFSGIGSGLTSLNASNIASGTVADTRLSTNVALRAGGNTFSGNQFITNGNVGIGTTSPVQALQVGDSSVLGSQGMIHLASRSPTSGSARDWDIGVPQTGDNAFGIGYSFVINDSANPSGADFLVQWGSGFVGIGTTNPFAPLDVSGGIHGAGTFNLNSYGYPGVSSIIRAQPGDYIPFAVQDAIGNNVILAYTNGDVVMERNAFAASFSGTFYGNGIGLTDVPGAIPSRVTAGTSVQASPNNTYDLSSSNQTTVTLPAYANVGDIVNVNGLGAGGWQVQAGSSQAINGFPAAGASWFDRGNSNDWNSVASSADGTKLFAVEVFNPDYIYASTNSGSTWGPLTGLFDYLYSVASSADGTKLVAASQGDTLYVSTNSGLSWTATGPSLAYWFGVASSADGSRLVAVAASPSQGYPVYISTNSGASWSPQGPSTNWSCVASSADGTRLIAGTFSGLVYTSTNGGTSWTAVATNGAVSAVASSADGSKLAVAPNTGFLMTSTNGGASWTPNLYDAGWTSVAFSPDGSKLAACSYLAPIEISADGGLTWGSGTVTNIYAIAWSTNDNKIVALEGRGDIHTSSGSPLSGAEGASVSLAYAGNGVWQPVNLPGSATDVPNTTISRDGNGNFAAGTISASALNASGAVAAASFSGNGAGLTGLSATNITGTLTTAQIPNLDASKITTGTFPDARLSANVALRAGGNTFTGPQVFTNNGYVDMLAPVTVYSNLSIGGFFLAPGPYPLGFDNNLGDKISLYTDGSQYFRSNNYGFGIQGSQLQIHSDTSASDIVFGYGQSASMTETMRIKGNGRVGIGSTSPQQMLQVGDSGVAGAQGMIHMASRSPSGSAGRDWDIGVPQTTNNTSGTGYSFIIHDTGLPFPAQLMVQWGSGNIGIGNTNPLNMLVVGPSASPAYCNGTTWVNGSDRNIKEDFAAINPSSILEKVSALPITEWKYKAESDGTRHVGPVAQDFHAFFGLNGADDTHIATVDESGVALAAIKGLNQKLEEQVKERDARIQSLEERLERIEKLIANPDGEHLVQH
jgi:hypothetical protein